MNSEPHYLIIMCSADRYLDRHTHIYLHIQGTRTDTTHSSSILGGISLFMIGGLGVYITYSIYFWKFHCIYIHLDKKCEIPSNLGTVLFDDF